MGTARGCWGTMRSGLPSLFRIGPFARVFGAASPLRLLARPCQSSYHERTWTGLSALCKDALVVKYLYYCGLTPHTVDTVSKTTFLLPRTTTTKRQPSSR